MKTTTWNRNSGFVSVVIFENGTAFAVSTKTYKTRRGAEGANTRLKNICGDGYSKQNIPWKTTDDDGNVTVNYVSENRTSV
jgi:hypothetical protein